MSKSLRLKQILKEIEERDRNDSTRAIAPLIQASDAHLIDGSDLTVEQVTQLIHGLVPSKKLYPRMKFSYWISYWIARLFFKIFFRLKVYGSENFRPGAGVIVANHTSLYDPPVLSISCPEEVHFLAKEALFKIPLLGRLIRLLNTHSISRSATNASIFRELIGLLRAKKKLILFPEGTRSRDGVLRPLERGLAFIAKKTHCPIFPVYIQGTFEAWPVDRKFPKIFGKISVVFGSTIEWNDFIGLDEKLAEQSLTETTADALRRLKNWLEEGAEGSPP